MNLDEWELLFDYKNFELVKQLVGWAEKEERKRCAKEVHQMWIDGFPAQEFADRLRRKALDLT